MLLSAYLTLGNIDYNLNNLLCTRLPDTLPVQSMAKQSLNAAETSALTGALSDDLAALRPGVRTDTEDTN